MAEEKKIIRISVRHLVEFLLRSGSIETGPAGPAGEAAMLEGARIHRKLQKEAGDGYRAEVPLRMEVPLARDLPVPASVPDGSGGVQDEAATDGKGAEPCGHLPEENGRSHLSIPLALAGMDPSLERLDALLCLEGRADGIFFLEKENGAAPPSDEDVLSAENGLRIAAGGSAPDGSAVSEEGIWTVDEIKTLYGRLGALRAPEEVHLAQARCYAYMYAHREGLRRIRIRMTYCSQATEEVRYFYEELRTEELEEWFYGLVRAYAPWAALQVFFARQRLESIRGLVFPFPYREGQYELAAGVYRTIVHGKKLFLQAPTGTGKTMAVLFPSLKAIGEGKADRVFYLTAKAVTGRAAVDALQILCEKGLCIRSLVLAAKERVCACRVDDGPVDARADSPGNGRVDCRPSRCPRADGHYDRVNAALWELLQEAVSGTPMTTGRIADCAQRHCVCPYELSMDAAAFADVVVCDYNYVFHPVARLTRFFGDGAEKGTVLLVDEAHNLLERGRGMYSAEFSEREVRYFRRSIRDVWPRLWKSMKGLTQAFKKIEKEQKEAEAPAKTEGGQKEAEALTKTEGGQKEAEAPTKTEGGQKEAELLIKTEGGQKETELLIKTEGGQKETEPVSLYKIEKGRRKTAGQEGRQKEIPGTGILSPSGRENLLRALQETGSAIRWILEQENRSAAWGGELHGKLNGELYGERQAGHPDGGGKPGSGFPAKARQMVFAAAGTDGDAGTALSITEEGSVGLALSVTEEGSSGLALSVTEEGSSGLALSVTEEDYSGTALSVTEEGSAGLPELLEFYFRLSHFQNMLEGLDGHYIVYASHPGFSLHLFCADPSARLQECMEKTAAAIFFSATFLPIQYYKGLLGGTAEDFEMYARSSFSPAQQKVVLVREVTSRYRDRNEETYRRIAQSILGIVSCRPGNYMAFFPSYAFLENVRDAFCRLPGAGLSDGKSEDGGTIYHIQDTGDDVGTGTGTDADIDIDIDTGAESDAESDADADSGANADVGVWSDVVSYTDADSHAGDAPVELRLLVQRPKMEDAERTAFLEAFHEVRPGRSLVGFCVLGGMFGEGIDLRGDRLIGSIVVGTGIPPVEPQREMLRAYFSTQGKNGYDYAYRFPGMNKVLQAAGRVIRTARDRGVVLLLDGRFHDPSNRALFPVEWGRPVSAGSREAAEIVRRFWASLDEQDSAPAPASRRIIK